MNKCNERKNGKLIHNCHLFSSLISSLRNIKFDDTFPRNMKLHWLLGFNFQPRFKQEQEIKTSLSMKCTLFVVCQWGGKTAEFSFKRVLHSIASDNWMEVFFFLWKRRKPDEIRYDTLFFLSTAEPQQWKARIIWCWKEKKEIEMPSDGFFMFSGWIASSDSEV